jgi:hemoglobin
VAARADSIRRAPHHFDIPAETVPPLGPYLRSGGALHLRNARADHHSRCWRTTMKATVGSFAIALVACALSNTSAVAQTRTLYDRLGGYPAISAVVDDFVANVAADRRINRFFAKANIDRLKARLVEQICQGTGGPCFYSGGDMKSVHAGMGIQGKHFNALVGDLGKTLNKFKVPAREQKELVAILAPMKKDIVTR